MNNTQFAAMMVMVYFGLAFVVMIALVVGALLDELQRHRERKRVRGIIEQKEARSAETNDANPNNR